MSAVLGMDGFIFAIAHTFDDLVSANFPHSRCGATIPTTRRQYENLALQPTALPVPTADIDICDMPASRFPADNPYGNLCILRIFCTFCTFIFCLVLYGMGGLSVAHVLPPHFFTQYFVFAFNSLVIMLVWQVDCLLATFSAL